MESRKEVEKASSKEGANRKTESSPLEPMTFKEALDMLEESPQMVLEIKV